MAPEITGPYWPNCDALSEEVGHHGPVGKHPHIGHGMRLNTAGLPVLLLIVYLSVLF